eukprot:TRINITY_DN398_c3_g1_i1.p1 TRINITY_DN398_c3_g1~~TRINITY_DN398_c3_g1_i1.p1  ORF type:complete len:472 (+),score=117.35 TRINITY_DN398_c3_g1_i1:33-1418(+)
MEDSDKKNQPKNQNQKKQQEKQPKDNAQGKQQKQQQNKQQGQQQQKLQPEGNRQRKKSESKQRVNTNVNVQFDNPQKRKQAQKQRIIEREDVEKPFLIFSHLPQYKRIDKLSLSIKTPETKADMDSFKIHPIIVSLGLKYANNQIQGSNARCVAMLSAFEVVLKEFQLPPTSNNRMVKEILLQHFSPMIQFLADCRPLSIGMSNAITSFKTSMKRAADNPDLTFEAKREYILEDLVNFRDRKVAAADALIATNGVQKIHDGDVVLTYSSSHVVRQVLKKAYDSKTKFRVVVVDSNPRFEGRTQLEKLSSYGIDCTYVLLSGLSYIMKEVSKVIIGAHALLNNGAVVSRTGTAVVAMMAHAAQVPVMVACETYKFYDRVQLDSICFNEVEDPEDLVAGDVNETKLQTWRKNNKLKLLNLAYDTTPMEYVSVVVTEMGMIPPTSVPVVIREVSQKNELQSDRD